MLAFLSPLRSLRNLYRVWRSHKLTNDARIKQLMLAFVADEYGHEANLATADLGYGFIHYGLIRQIKPKTVLCVGSRFGYIPAILAQACHDNGFGRVYFVDAGFDDSEAGAYTGQGYWKTPTGKASFDEFGLGKYIALFVTTTKKFVARYPQQKFDYIYIDGDHSYKGAKFDYKTFWPRLNPLGLMTFHDISVKETLPEGEYGVHQVFSEAQTKTDALVFPFLGSGLGILQKNGNPK